MKPLHAKFRAPTLGHPPSAVRGKRAWRVGGIFVHKSNMIHTYMHVYMHRCIKMYIYVYTYTYIYIYTYICIYRYAHISLSSKYSFQQSY